ncbi:MAG: hypothetical protein KGZ86_04170 [Candidatus Latescibacteria bacterium]|nr:hypothetical protein [Candidatus Latescibacterota bacterium]
MTLNKTMLLLIGIILAITSCTRVMVPPAVNLTDYQVVGIIKFRCSEGGNLDAFVTQKFIEEITRDQKMMQIMELGNEAAVLAEVQKPSLNIDAYKAIGEKYNLKSIIFGDIDISDIQPEITIAPGFSFVGVRGIIEAKLVARMIETENGATVWTGSALDKREIGHISFAGGRFMFDAKDPERAYGPLTETLVRNSTKDFRKTHYFRCGKKRCL